MVFPCEGAMLGEGTQLQSAERIKRCWEGGGLEDVGRPKKYVNICPSQQPWPDDHFFCFCKHQYDNASELCLLLAEAFPTTAATSDMLIEKLEVLCD